MKLIKHLKPFELNDIVSHANDGIRTMANPVTAATHWLQSLNSCWNSLREKELNARREELGDKQLFGRMLERYLCHEDKKALLNGRAVRDFLSLRPFVMDMDALPRETYDPANPNPRLVEASQLKHRVFCEKYADWSGDVRDTRRADAAIRSLSEAIYVVRCNLNHCGKFARGPDENKVQRDRVVTHIASRVLRDMVSLLLDCPEHKLAAYGSLRPGDEHHAVVAECSGAWKAGKVKGTISRQDEFDLFDWNISGSDVSVKVLVSEDLPNKWLELDKFEGPSYARAWIPVQLDCDTLDVASIYVRKPTAREVWA